MNHYEVMIPAFSYYTFRVKAESAAAALQAVLDRKAGEGTLDSEASGHTRIATPASMSLWADDKDPRAWYWPLIENLDTGECHDAEAEDELRQIAESQDCEVKTWPSEDPD